MNDFGRLVVPGTPSLDGVAGQRERRPRETDQGSGRVECRSDGANGLEDKIKRGRVFQPPKSVNIDRRRGRGYE